MTLARETYPEMRSQYQEDLRGCLKLAAAANVIDFFREPGSIKEDIRKTVNFALDDSERLEAKLKNAGKILYLADTPGNFASIYP